MPSSHRAELQQIRTFPQLIRFLRDEMGWPIETEAYDDLVFDYSPEELGLGQSGAANIKDIRRLRPLVANQPWGIFFVKFEPKRLPVVALRRILSAFVMRKRASANSADRMTWETDDLLFISNYGEDEERQLSFAHFSRNTDGGGLPTLKVLGWDNRDTALHLDDVAEALTQRLAWPADDTDAEHWRESWRSAFTLRHREVITTSRELSIRLAELARAIRDCINTALTIETEQGPLTQLMKAFRGSLVHDLEPDGFADMYAQTIAYGLLSARIADPRSKTTDDLGAHMRTNPLLRDLMTTFLDVGGTHGGSSSQGLDFDELGVNDVVQLLDDANMGAVLRDFGDRNPQEDPVIHFYELFLKEYDAAKRIQRGVFYTPRPVASYIVRSVDELLRSEFGLADGLADITTWGEMAERHEGLAIPKGVDSTAPFVTILDLATGTGTFLVETIDVVHRTLVEKWKREGNSESEILDLWNDYVPKHLLPRLYGYELLMAPYAIAHLKLGLKLHETGYRFGSEERARVYLTNALEPAQDFSGQFDFAIPALAQEAQAVNDVKRNRRFTVVLGNPPYAQMSANLTTSAVAMVDPYRYLDGTRIVEKSALSLERNLNDDYVKFVRLAESLVGGSWGILGYITNNAYLEAITLRGLRWHLLETFSRLQILDLHGDTDKRDVASDGSADENVFEIKKGVAIALLVRSIAPAHPELGRAEMVGRSDLRGTCEAKVKWLAGHVASSTEWQGARPHEPGYLFVARDEPLAKEYALGIPLTRLMPESATGFTSGYDQVLTGFSPDELEATLREFADLPESQLAERFSISGVFAKKTFHQRSLIALRRLRISWTRVCVASVSERKVRHGREEPTVRESPRPLGAPRSRAALEPCPQT